MGTSPLYIYFGVSVDHLTNNNFTEKDDTKMKIALDYDETFTAAPMLFKPFVLLAQQQGHLVTFVTFRSSKYCDNHDIEADANELGIDIVFTEGKQKQHVFKADIWIDDSPDTIVDFKLMGDTYDGCLLSGDVE